MVKHIASTCSGWLSMKQLMMLSGTRLILPFYHVVSDQEAPHYKHLYPVKSVSEFEADLDFLLQHFRPITLNELMEQVTANRKFREPVFHLTFDDGLRELYEVVAPILKQRGIPATFFINTDFMDNKSMFYRFKASLMVEEFGTTGMLELSADEALQIDDFAETMGYSFDGYLKANQPYLTSDQIKNLIGQGFTIGGHSLNHPLFSDLNVEEQVNQALSSVRILCDQFRLDYGVFSFPFTDHGVGREFFRQVNTTLDLTFGTAGIKKDITSKNLQRVPMEQPETAEAIIKTQYMYAVMKNLVGRNRIRR
ncbi:MAG: polysaccharide deacetylase family protein [Flavobacteriales bacterium]|nr:polysaccharide deacetylase family protein [Flavobacteriales bacterium]